MNNHHAQPLSAREMVRAHAYPVLACISSLSLVALAVLQIPTAVKDNRFNRCIDTQMQLRRSPQLMGQDGPGKLLYLKAVAHCKGR